MMKLGCRAVVAVTVLMMTSFFDAFATDAENRESSSTTVSSSDASRELAESQRKIDEAKKQEELEKENGQMASQPTPLPTQRDGRTVRRGRGVR